MYLIICTIVMKVNLSGVPSNFHHQVKYFGYPSREIVHTKEKQVFSPLDNMGLFFRNPYPNFAMSFVGFVSIFILRHF